MPTKRKKWTEEEERTLIDKYGEMSSDGSLAKCKTREKKFRPIAAHVNAAHHAVNPAAYPFHWSWKDASTKVQNMRHQYLLVKQKLVSSTTTAGSTSPVVNWADGVSHWPNFLRYKHVFGDHPLFPPTEVPPLPLPDSCFDGDVAGGIAMEGDDGDLGLGLGFDCDAEDGEEDGFDYEEVPPPPSLPLPLPLVPFVPRKRRRKRTERQAWTFLEAQLARLRDRELELEKREAEQGQEWRRRDLAQAKLEEERDQAWRQRSREMEEEWEERVQRHKVEEREWEERMERRKVEWRKRVEGMLTQHRAGMEQIHARIVHDQQSIINQLLGFITQWVGPATNSGGLSDGAGMLSHHHTYLSQMMQNVHHVNGMVHGETRVGGDSQDGQFIVDG